MGSFTNPCQLSLGDNINYVNAELSVSCYWTNRYDEGLQYLTPIMEDPIFNGHEERLTRNYNFFN